MMKSKVVLITCYFGKLPNYFPLWLKSCAYNETFNWIVFTDDKSKYDSPKNVKIIIMSFDDMRKLVKSKVNFATNINKPYKLCDFKVLYGKIFAEYINEYSHWGHCDLDVIWGNLSKFITDDKLQKYDRLFDLGHLSIYKNTDIVNDYYKKEYSGLDYKTILESPHHFGFDENKGMNLIYKENYIPMLVENVCADINYRYFEINVNRINVKHDYFIFDKGQLWGYNQGKPTKEYLYVHLQKRKMLYKKEIESLSKYYIFPISFSADANVQYNLLDKLYFTIKMLKNDIGIRIKWNYHWRLKWVTR